MNKTSESNPDDFDSSDMLPEYRFDYQKARPNRFVTPGQRRLLTVALDDDVAEVFTTPEAVNKALRALIEVVPQSPGRKG